MTQVSQRARRLIKSQLFVITLNPKIWCQSSGLYWDNSWWISFKYLSSRKMKGKHLKCIPNCLMFWCNVHYRGKSTFENVPAEFENYDNYFGEAEREDKQKEWCWWKEMITSRRGFDRRKVKFLCQVSVRMKTKPAVSTGKFDSPSPVLSDCL